MKTAIVYYSRHHGNTLRVLEAIQHASTDEIVLLDVTTMDTCDLSGYDRIGYASGIYYSKFHKKLLAFAKENTPVGKEVFLVCTYGAEKSGYTRAMRDVLAERQAHIGGEFGCLGFNTFGPFKWIGGLAKGHPDQNDLVQAAAFYQQLK